eukprot:3418537-Rhodomonas_salina.2
MQKQAIGCVVDQNHIPTPYHDLRPGRIEADIIHHAGDSFPLWYVYLPAQHGPHGRASTHGRGRGGKGNSQNGLKTFPPSLVYAYLSGIRAYGDFVRKKKHPRFCTGKQSLLY